MRDIDSEFELPGINLITLIILLGTSVIIGVADYCNIDLRFREAATRKDAAEISVSKHVGEYINKEVAVELCEAHAGTKIQREKGGRIIRSWSVDPFEASIGKTIVTSTLTAVSDLGFEKSYMAICM